MSLGELKGNPVYARAAKVLKRQRKRLWRQRLKDEKLSRCKSNWSTQHSTSFVASSGCKSRRSLAGAILNHFLIASNVAFSIAGA
jgi:hypothetical protein